AATLIRSWDTSDDTNIGFEKILQNCKDRVDAAFEFFVKLGVDYYCFHDRDVAPELLSSRNFLNDLKFLDLPEKANTRIKKADKLIGKQKYSSAVIKICKVLMVIPEELQT
ncbi:hypothetical protein HK099_002986, partial [Clydaea vesicula]